MERDKALRVLAAHRDELLALGVKQISIFGSVARNEAGLDSDIDVLVEHETDAPLSFFRVCRLRYFLDEILGAKVDLVTVGGLRPEIREEVMAAAIRAAWALAPAHRQPARAGPRLSTPDGHGRTRSAPLTPAARKTEPCSAGCS